MKTRAYVLEKFWKDHISVENGPKGDTALYAWAPLTVPKATFSFAMRVMDKVGSKFAASMWIDTKAVLCDGRGRPPQDLRQVLRI